MYQRYYTEEVLAHEFVPWHLQLKPYNHKQLESMQSSLYMNPAPVLGWSTIGVDAKGEEPWNDSGCLTFHGGPYHGHCQISLLPSTAGWVVGSLPYLL